MSAFSRELIEHDREIVHAWYERWRSSEHPHHDVAEAALKDSLPEQLRLVGEQLERGAQAEHPEQLWRRAERLDPEKRIVERVPIEEVVQEYGLAVDTVRDWVEQRDLEVGFEEYSYFYQALFELTAESVRRYAKREADILREARANHVAAVMHQLRAPLQAASSAVDVLGAAKDGGVERIRATLRRSVDRIRGLVDRMLRLERYEPSEVPVRPRDLSLRDEVEHALDDVRPEAKRKGLRLEAAVAPDLRARLDPELLADAVGNLVQNAVKFTSSGFVAVTADAAPDGVTLHVRDSGPGIPEDRRARLFLEKLRGGGEGGAGIGLRIARQAAQAMGGEVTLERTGAEGSTFCVRLPRRVEPRDGDLNARGAP